MSSDQEATQDEQRLRDLQQTRLLDSGPEESFDRFTRLASALIDAPVSLVSLVDHDRQFFKSHFGLGEPWATLRETPLTHSFCQHVVRSREPLVIVDAEKDERVRGNRAIPELGVRAYLGVPLQTARGHVLGSFCAIDQQPRKWTPEDIRIMEDLGAAVTREIELRALSTEALAGLLTLQNLENQRDEMVHMLVHDLRNPLTSLLAGLDMLEIVPGLTDQQAKYIDRARSGGRAMLQMINEILIVSKGEAGMLDLSFSTVAPLDLIDGAVDLLAQLAKSKGVSIRIQGEDLPTVSADAGMLSRVLVNLIANALAHSPPGGEVAVTARLQASEAGIEFAVSDSGEGISRSDLERIFDKFEQAHLGAGRAGSSGLGLTFCRTVIDQHGGQIRAESTPGEGATFVFHIPLDPGPRTAH